MVDIVYSTLSDAQASVTSAINGFQTQGYSSPGDFGGATYRKTTATSGPGVFAAGGAYWENASPILSPEMFGAKGDGATLDHGPLQTALNIHRIVRLSPGKVYLTGIPLQPPTGSRLWGDGTSTIKTNGAFHAIHASGASDLEFRNFRVDGSRVGGENPTPPTSYGIFVNWSSIPGSKVLIDGVEVFDTGGIGILVIGKTDGTYRCGNVQIVGCRVADTGAHGIVVQDHIDDVLIERNQVFRTSLYPLRYPNPVTSPYIEGPGITAARNGSNIVISNNVCIGERDVAGLSVHAISLDTTENATCVGNVCANWRAYGIEVGFATQIAVTGNTIRDCGYGIVMSGVAPEIVNGEYVGGFRCRDVAVTGNVISDVAYGIWSFLDTTAHPSDGGFLHENFQITGNTVLRCDTGTDGFGCWLGLADNVSIIGNTFAYCFRGGLLLTDVKNYFIDGCHIHNNNVKQMKDISSITSSETTATATCNSHGYTSTDLVSVFGTSPTAYSVNGAGIFGITSNTFNYTISESGLPAAEGTLKCTALNDIAYGGLRIMYSSIQINDRGINRLGVNNIQYNGCRNFYDVESYGVTGITGDALFLADRSSLIRPENLTTDAPDNIMNRAAIFIRNNKLVIAYNIGGTTSYTYLPLVASGSAAWTVGAP